ncbi:MAG TPA: tRNA lysidine(34) synthetase TilS [Haliangium sp.]|nr:tRNA lysidine(34) synthetase TilS [Haliangium sp.]
MHPLHADIARALRALGVTREHAVGVACSGGPDSAALAHACLALARRGALGSVTLLHIHHGLRPDAGRDAEVVRALAEQGGGRAVIRDVAVDRARASLEAAARDARYAALDALASELGLRWIATAHTASDQAETVLMRVMRGTGVTGLAGIPATRGIYLRPLLGVTRPEIEAYCQRFGVAAVSDPMNEDPAFLRNRVRHHWLPALRSENPRIDEALCRLAEAAADDRAVLEYAAEMLLTQARAPLPDGLPDSAVALDAACLAQAPAAVRRRATSLVAARAGTGPLEARHLRALDELATRPAAGSVRLSLPGGTAVREYDRLVIAGHAAQMDDAQPDLALIQVTGPDGPYEVRRWQAGDRMRPARLRGRSRKLSDLFTDARVPRRLRGRAVIVIRAADGVIVWAEHIGPAFGCDVSVCLTPGIALASN